MLGEGASDASTADAALPMDTKPVIEEAKQVSIASSAVLNFPYVQPAHDSPETVLQTAELAGCIWPRLAGLRVALTIACLSPLLDMLAAHIVLFSKMRSACLLAALHP